MEPQLSKQQVLDIFRRLQAGEAVDGWGYTPGEWREGENGGAMSPGSFYRDISNTERQGYDEQGNVSGSVFNPGAGYRRSKKYVEPLALAAFGTALGYGLLNPGAYGAAAGLGEAAAAGGAGAGGTAASGGAAGAAADFGIGGGLSQLTPAAMEAGLGTAGYGTNAAAGIPGLFNPATIGAGAGLTFGPGVASAGTGLAGLGQSALTGVQKYGNVLGPLLGGVISSSGAKSAARAQADAANKAADLQKQQFDKVIELQEPFRQAGLTGQNRLMELLGLAGDPNAPGYGSAMRDFGMQDFQADPGYEFRRQQGMQGLERSASARGGLLSGAAMKDAMRFNQGLASDEYTNAFNRFQTNRSNKLNPLQSLSGMAQSSTNQISNAGQNYANNAGNALMGAGNARASGYVGSANALNNAIGQGMNMYQDTQWMNRRYPQGGPW